VKAFSSAGIRWGGGDSVLAAEVGDGFRIAWVKSSSFVNSNTLPPDAAAISEKSSLPDALGDRPILIIFGMAVAVR
jgi:hypothetical protein